MAQNTLIQVRIHYNFVERSDDARIDAFYERGLADTDGFVRSKGLACRNRRCGDIYDWLKTCAGARDIHITGIPRSHYKMGGAWL